MHTNANQKVRVQRKEKKKKISFHLGNCRMYIKKENGIVTNVKGEMKLKFCKIEI